jgi:ATP:cob(I)alamin adenosyltransferase
MNYYTGTGDDGKTSLAGRRVSKTDKTIKALGDLDELLAFIGDANSKIKQKSVKTLLKTIEKNIYKISAQVSGYAGVVKKSKTLAITDADMSYLEGSIALYSRKLKYLSKFVYPDGSPAGTALNICRTVARRAERSLLGAGISDKLIMKYMNRMSSLFLLCLDL